MTTDQWALLDFTTLALTALAVIRWAHTHPRKDRT